MKRETLLTISVILLLLLNFGTLGYLFLRRPPGPPPPRIDRIIIETLNWDEKQREEFDKLKREHRSSMNELDRQNENAARRYFILLSTNPIDSIQKDSLERIMADVEIKKADITFHHFEDLKKICRPDQIRNFDSLIPQLVEILIPPLRGPGPPSKD